MAYPDPYLPTARSGPTTTSNTFMQMNAKKTPTAPGIVPGTMMWAGKWQTPAELLRQGGNAYQGALANSQAYRYSQAIAPILSQTAGATAGAIGDAKLAGNAARENALREMTAMGIDQSSPEGQARMAALDRSNVLAGVAGAGMAGREARDTRNRIFERLGELGTVAPLAVDGGGRGNTVDWSSVGFNRNGWPYSKGMAEGGEVVGPGGPKDDAIPAMIDGAKPTALSSGEHVITAEGVDLVGPELLDAINALAKLKKMFNGGTADAAASGGEGYADGGAVTGLSAKELSDLLQVQKAQETLARASSTQPVAAAPAAGMRLTPMGQMGAGQRDPGAIHGPGSGYIPLVAIRGQDGLVTHDPEFDAKISANPDYADSAEAYGPGAVSAAQKEMIAAQKYVGPQEIPGYRNVMTTPSPAPDNTESVLARLSKFGGEGAVQGYLAKQGLIEGKAKPGAAVDPLKEQTAAALSTLMAPTSTYRQKRDAEKALNALSLVTGKGGASSGGGKIGQYDPGPGTRDLMGNVTPGLSAADQDRQVKELESIRLHIGNLNWKLAQPAGVVSKEDQDDARRQLAIWEPEYTKRLGVTTPGASGGVMGEQSLDGHTLVGYKNGKPVYQDAQGNRFISEE